jgi:CDP-paratose 2-epimerase
MSDVVVITGSAGLIGSEAAQFVCEHGHHVVGIDNDMRSRFFGPDAGAPLPRRDR